MTKRKRMRKEAARPSSRHKRQLNTTDTTSKIVSTASNTEQGLPVLDDDDDDELVDQSQKQRMEVDLQPRDGKELGPNNQLDLQGNKNSNNNKNSVQRIKSVTPPMNADPCSDDGCNELDSAVSAIGREEDDNDDDDDHNHDSKQDGRDGAPILCHGNNKISRRRHVNRQKVVEMRKRLRIQSTGLGLHIPSHATTTSAVAAESVNVKSKIIFNDDNGNIDADDEGDDDDKGRDRDHVEQDIETQMEKDPNLKLEIGAGNVMEEQEEEDQLQSDDDHDDDESAVEEVTTSQAAIQIQAIQKKEQSSARIVNSLFVHNSNKKSASRKAEQGRKGMDSKEQDQERGGKAIERKDHNNMSDDDGAGDDDDDPGDNHALFFAQVDAARRRDQQVQQHAVATQSKNFNQHVCFVVSSVSEDASVPKTNIGQSIQAPNQKGIQVVVLPPMVGSGTTNGNNLLGYDEEFDNNQDVSVYQNDPTLIWNDLTATNPIDGHDPGDKHRSEHSPPAWFIVDGSDIAVTQQDIRKARHGQGFWGHGVKKNDSLHAAIAKKKTLWQRSRKMNHIMAAAASATTADHRGRRGVGATFQSRHKKGVAAAHFVVSK